MLDLIGVGVGPFNLSLAALLDGVGGVRARFFEARPRIAWHAGLLFDDATVQSPYLKDLVTLVDPTSPFSFLNYLRCERRLHRFIIAGYPNVLRKEFNAYFEWVARRLPTLTFGAAVERVDFSRDRFVVSTQGSRLAARNIVLGVGRVPNVPEPARPHLGPSVFHGTEYLHRRSATRGKRVAIIGGGQTGAEIFHDLIGDRTGPPAHVTWATRRHNFLPFDESAFANELYVPGYTRHFFGLPPAQREWLLERQKTTSDGISESLLQRIYQRLYELDHLCGEGTHGYRLLVDRRLRALTRDGGAWTVVTDGPAGCEHTRVDVVILATGFRFAVPAALEPILDRIRLDGEGRFRMQEDFAISWAGPPRNRIYAHNASLHGHGWVDPNFAGMAWRSAVIINSLLERSVYDTDGGETAIDWGGPPAAAVEHERRVAG